MLALELEKTGCLTHVVLVYLIYSVRGTAPAAASGARRANHRLGVVFAGLSGQFFLVRLLRADFAQCALVFRREH
ncbi:hypothetical protein SB861_67285, partial [Paraburkholderia sp. SIMBA_049]